MITLAATAAGMFSGTLYAQKGKEKPASAPASSPAPDKEAAMYRATYERAIRFNDLAVASDAVYSLLNMGESQAHYLDTLAILYFQRGAWPQTVLVTNDILAKEPNKAGPLELRAVAHQSLGMVKESLADYERLYPITQNAYHLYEIAALQYTMRRFGECELTLGRLLQDETIKDKTLQLNSGQQTTQSVPLNAACHNMAGVVLLDQGRKSDAVMAFKKALNIYPEFVLAKNNLTEAEKP